MAASESSTPAPDRPRPLFARLYARITEGMDQQGLADLRREMLGVVSGRVVEVGCGNGMNFAHYPATVTQVHAIEPEPYLRDLALSAAKRAPVPVTVSPGRGDAIPFPAGFADSGVLCMALCSMPDERAAASELARVIRAGGVLVFLEHCAGRDARAALGSKSRRRNILAATHRRLPHRKGSSRSHQRRGFRSHGNAAFVLSRTSRRAV